MNGILGMCGLLLETRLNGEQGSYARAIDQSAKTLLALIDEILDFSKIEAGKLELDCAPFNLACCVQDVVELLAPRAHEKGLEIAWIIEPHVPALLIGDETRLRQILLNLIGNAVKFTDRGGILVSTSATSVGDDAWRVAIAVKDTGIGLSEEATASLFAEFGQVEAPLAQRRGGTGLGLAISRRLARAMGGDIRVDSKLGRGATFTTELALRAAPGAAARPTMARLTTGAPTVLLAFDRMIERRALATMLDRLGIPAFETGADVIEDIERAAYAGQAVNVIMVDVQDGTTEAKRMLDAARARASGPVRGIVLVDAGTRSNLRGFKEAGFDNFLVRPVRLQTLLVQLGLGFADSKGAAEAAHMPSELARTSPVLQGLNVLLAEDNQINAMLTRRLLEKSGARCTHVEDGQAAIEAVQSSMTDGRGPFDLILMDVFMPKLDGLEATRRIRAIAAAEGSRGRRLPIVALTANAFAEDRQRCLDAGCDDYLAKPFQRHELEAVLSRWSTAGWLDPKGALSAG